MFKVKYVESVWRECLGVSGERSISRSFENFFRGSSVGFLKAAEPARSGARCPLVLRLEPTERRLPG